MTIINVGLETHQGMQRKENQDYAAYRSLKDLFFIQNGILMVLADGMGGHAGGAVASKLAVGTLINEFSSKKHHDIDGDLERIFQKANDVILNHSRQNPHLKGMGTTLTAVVIQNDELFFAHVGDSRGYLVSDAGIHQLTEDHTYVADLLRQGLISPAEAENHPYDNIITRAIGVSANPRIDHAPISYKIKSKQSVVLCSDGLYKCVANNEIFDFIKRYPDPSEACGELITCANQRGGPDNITVMIAQLEQVSPSFKPKWLRKLRKDRP